MSSEFPKYSNNARKGELGVQAVSNIIFNDFGWIFRRTPQEFDFGIDGNIDVVASGDQVTGQQCAVQIKYGESYLREKSKWGYIYRGEKKHLSYLENYPVPVLIVLVDPADSSCYWVDFDLRKIETTERNWRIEVPSKNLLEGASAQIVRLLPKIENPEAKIENYKRFRDVAIDANWSNYAIERDAVRRRDISGPRELFDRLRATQDMAAASVESVDIFFEGCDEDERELWEIEEIRDYVALLDNELPELLYFVSTTDPAYTLKTFAYCTSETHRGSTTDGELEVRCETRGIVSFVSRHLDSFTELNKWTNRGGDESKEHYRRVLNCFNLLDGLPAEDVERLLASR